MKKTLLIHAIMIPIFIILIVLETIMDQHANFDAAQMIFCVVFILSVIGLIGYLITCIVSFILIFVAIAKGKSVSPHVIRMIISILMLLIINVGFVIAFVYSPAAMSV